MRRTQDEAPEGINIGWQFRQKAKMDIENAERLVPSMEVCAKQLLEDKEVALSDVVNLHNRAQQRLSLPVRWVYHGEDLEEEEANDVANGWRLSMYSQIVELSSKLGLFIPVLKSHFANAKKDEDAFDPETFKQALTGLAEDVTVPWR